MAILTDARRGALEAGAAVCRSRAPPRSGWHTESASATGSAPRSTITAPQSARICCRHLDRSRSNESRPERLRRAVAMAGGAPCAAPGEQARRAPSRDFRARRANPRALDNPAAGVERLKIRYDPSAYDFYSPEEVWALVRAAASEQDGAIYLVAAFAGLRRASCWPAVARCRFRAPVAAGAGELQPRESRDAEVREGRRSHSPLRWRRRWRD